MVECERGEGWKNDKYLNVANRVFGHLAIAGEGGAGKKPAGVGGGGNESPENDRTNEEGDHENCDNKTQRQLCKRLAGPFIPFSWSCLV